MRLTRSNLGSPINLISLKSIKFLIAMGLNEYIKEERLPKKLVNLGRQGRPSLTAETQALGNGSTVLHGDGRAIGRGGNKTVRAVAELQDVALLGRPLGLGIAHA